MRTLKISFLDWEEPSAFEASVARFSIMNNEVTHPGTAGGPWDVGMERIPLVTFDGDSIHIENYRNFRYECDGTHEENYEVRTVSVPSIVSADFIVVPFATQRDLAHTMMSFGFEDGQHIVVSVEARRRLNQKYGIIKGIFGAFPLMYAIADERDAIGQRTEIRGDDVYLYPSSATPQEIQSFFRCVMHRVSKLSQSPETYNTITNNCLTNIRYHINRIWPRRIPWNWRLLINAHSDYLAYKLGMLQGHESFKSTREHANITPKAKGNWHREDFSAVIRK